LARVPGIADIAITAGTPTKATTNIEARYKNGPAGSNGPSGDPFSLSPRRVRSRLQPSGDL